MKRIDSSNRVGAEPAPPAPAASPGYFGSGDGAGIEGTYVTSDWLNDIQEEVISPIVTAGLTPTKGVRQMLAAIYALICPTGTMIAGLWTSAAPGWIMADDGTIGSATSGASNRQNADTAALYTLLWTNLSNTNAPVTGGRGASAAADFAANKPIRLPLLRGRAMASAGAGAGLSSRTLGSVTGEELTPLSAAQNGAHTHPMEGGNSPDAGGGAFLRATSGGGTLNTTSSGSGTPHQNMQPTLFVNYMIKL